MYLLEWLFGVPTRNQMSGVGRVIGFLTTTRECAGELAEQLYKILSGRENRQTPTPCPLDIDPDREFDRQVNAWIDTLRTIPGLMEDTRRAGKLRLPLFTFGWQIAGETLVKQTTGKAGLGERR